MGLEAPFVGRTGELRLVKDLFHAAAEESRARLVSVIGVAGHRQVTPLVGVREVHRRRRCGCLVASRSLPLLRRRRRLLGAGRDGARSREDPRGRRRGHVAREVAGHARGSGRGRGRACAGSSRASSISSGSPSERRAEREDLFSAWRRFFELLAEQGPLVLVVRGHPLGRRRARLPSSSISSTGAAIIRSSSSRWRGPSSSDRHPGFPGSNRSAATLPLEPLSDDAMDELLVGLVPGLPDDVRRRLRDAADGIPLYAVETVRMLRDRGVLEQRRRRRARDG